MIRVIDHIIHTPPYVGFFFFLKTFHSLIHAYTHNMELYIFLFCLSLLFLLLKPFLRRYSTTNLPPGPSSLPLIGSLHHLSPRLHESLYNLAKIHGPLMTIYLGSIITIVVSSPEIAKQVLQIHDQDFSERYVPDVITAQPNPESTLAWVPGNQRWRNRRRICTTQMFTKQRLDSQHHLRQLKVRQLIEHIKKHYFLGKHVDIGQVAFATTLNLISNTIFSVDIIDPGFEKAQEFKDLVWRIMEDAGKQNLSDIFPVLKFFDLQGLKRHIRPAYMRLHEIFDEMIEKRLESRKIGNERSGDFLDVLLDQCAEQGSDFDRHNIKPLILDLFIAGSDTSAITTEWAMTELLRNPEVLQKLRRELIEVIGADRAMQDSDIDQLPYLQAVVKETLRFHPPVPLLLPYKAVNNVEILGFNIPKNSRVLVNAWALGRDPKYWNNNPLSFSPERFLGSSNVDFKGRDFEYIPFGAGRRICPGLPLATRMVHLILGSIVHEFDWKLPEGVVSPMDLDMGELLGATLKKAVPLCAIPIQGNNT